MFANSPMILLSLLMLIGCAVAKNSVSEEEDVRKELREAFAQADKDGNGKITFPELQNIMKNYDNILTEKELKDLEIELNRVGDGMISYKEFMEKIHDDEEAAFTISFIDFDKNKDGFISSSELRDIMASLGEPLTEEEADIILKKADENGDGLINYEECAKQLTELSEM